MPRILDASDASIDEAVRRLRAGEPVVVPTETVYGLAAPTHDAAAIERVYALKGRPTDNPLIAHVAAGPTPEAHAAMLDTLVADWDERCRALADRFWPGPLTIIVAKSDAVPMGATAGRDTIAVRCPRHGVAQRVLEGFGAPLSAPSANRSGLVSPTSAAHVARDYEGVPGAEDLLVLDGGDCDVGLESTVLDLTQEQPTVLRPGSIGASALEHVVGPVAVPSVREQAASPGTSMRHYAPRTPVEVHEPATLGARLDELARAGATAAVLCFEVDVVAAPHRAFAMPQGAGDYGQRLYRVLRDADALGLACILVEAPPEVNEAWMAIRDRLSRMIAA